MDSHKVLLNQFKLRDANVVVNNALDGGDYIGTLVRAIPQFFFAYMLPLPLLQVALMGYCAFEFQRQARRRDEEATLTDEFILAYLATKPENADALSSDERAESARIEAAIERLRSSRERNIGALKKFANTESHKNAIQGNLGKKSNTSSSSPPNSYWNLFFLSILHYAGTHWVLWMAMSLAMATDIWEGDAGKNDHESTKDPSALPPMFNHPAAFWIEFIVPLMVVLGVWMYNYARKPSVGEQTSLCQMKENQENVRDYYLKNRADNNESAKTETTQAEFSETKALWLTRITSGLDAFLVLNLFAWPLCMFIQAQLGDQTLAPTDREPLDADVKIPVVFAITILLAIYHGYNRGEKMSQETGAKAEATYKPRQTFYEYYFKNPETSSRWNIMGKDFSVPTTFIYWAVSRATGSGGILLARILLDGGILGYLCHLANQNRYETESSMPHIEEMLGIGVALAGVVVTLNLYQTYYAAQRQNELNVQRDNHLRTRSTA